MLIYKRKETTATKMADDEKTSNAPITDQAMNKENRAKSQMQQHSPVQIQ